MTTGREINYCVAFDYWIIFNNSFLLYADEISAEYFSVLAERRRVALAEAIEENEKLHQEIDNLKSEVTTLKAENSVLKPLAEEAEYLASVLKVTLVLFNY
jgi:hypothetical protein